MSCLNLRLPLAKKIWKSFTSKLHKSKAIKIPNNNRLQTASSKTTTGPSLFLGQRLQQRKSRRRRRALPFGYQRYYYDSNDKAAAPVYIDKLFTVAPPVTELVGCIHQESSEKNVKLIDEVLAQEAGKIKEGEKEGDDMWESIGLMAASPMLHGIDARAEEFIASFRAEMDRQEIIARNL